VVPPDHEFSEAEERLRAAAVTGASADLRSGSTDVDDPIHGATWGSARTIRAEVLAELLTRPVPADSGPARPLSLYGARIIRTLNLREATLTRPLLLEDCYLDEPIILNDAKARAIRLPGCRLPGLEADRLEINGNLELSQGFAAGGEVRLIGAHVKGALNLDGAQLTDPSGYALAADGLIVDQNLLCRGGFNAEGEVRLIGAHVSGVLDLSGARLRNAQGLTLVADQLAVGRDLLCRELTTEGGVRLFGAHVSGVLDLSGARLVDPNWYALAVDGLTVDQSLFCREGFEAVGEVRLTGTHVKGLLDFSGARLVNEGGPALVAAGLIVDQHLLCRRAFNAEGYVSLSGATIGGALDISDAQAVEELDLTGTNVKVLRDDERSWPKVLRLDGFVYDTFETISASGSKRSDRQRLRWIRRDPDYAPQPYDQLAGFYRRRDDGAKANRVLIAKQWRRRSVFNPLNWLWYATVGFGYRTWLAGLWLVALMFLGTQVFDHAYAVHLLTAAKDKPGQQPGFHPAAYTLDLLLPIVNLGQESAWVPHSWAEPWSWAIILAGWALTTAFVAGLSGILKRN
jgi:hypothetical protein